MFHKFLAVSCDSAVVFDIYSFSGASGSAVGLSALLQARRSRFRFPIRSLEYFHFTESFQPQYGPEIDSSPNRNEYHESSWDKERPARKADNLTAICEPVV
jgi:hypothetical protein